MSQELNNSLPSQTQWTRYHDKLFEQALVTVPEDAPDRWEKIAEQVPGKSPEEMKYRYEALVRDVLAIESGLVEVPDYPDDVAAFPDRVWDSANQLSVSKTKSMGKKGTPWTEEEHQRFLMGLEKYGRGDWRSISRNFVVTRSPTQVASHAQKYFLRQSSSNKEKRRASIHDITTVDTNVVVPVIGQPENFLHQNPANNERIPVSIHDLTTMDPNLVPPAIGQAEHFLHQNAVNNERRPASIHDITTLDTNVVSPAIGRMQDPNSTNNRRRLGGIHDINIVDSNLVPPVIGPREDFLHQNWMNNETRTAGIHDIITVDSNTMTPAVGQNWVPPLEPQELQQWNPPYHFPDQLGGNGHTNYGYH